VDPRNKDPKPIIQVITVELTQHIHPRYINVTGGWTIYDSNTTVKKQFKREKSALSHKVSCKTLMLKLRTERNFAFSGN